MPAPALGEFPRNAVAHVEEFDAASVRAVANAAHDAVLIRTHNPLQASMVGAQVRE